MIRQRIRNKLARLIPGVKPPSMMPAEPGAVLPPLGQRLGRFKCFDFEMYVDRADRTVQPIIHHGVYESHILPLFRETVRPGMHVLDIGANVGVYAIAAALGGARVTAVDASVENCKIVAMNAELNKVDVTVLPMAVSDRMEMGLFPRSDDSNKAIRAYTLNMHQFDIFDAAFSAPISTVIGKDKVDVVKIDIEGREYAALKEADDLFAHRPVFFMEYSPLLCLHGSGVEGAQLLKLFVSRGYTMTFLGMRIPNEELGGDIEAANRIAQQELDAGVNIIDLMLRPPAR